jgi:hypothetical protein
MQNLTHDTHSQVKYLNLRPFKYQAGMINTRPWHSVTAVFNCKTLSKMVPYIHPQFYLKSKFYFILLVLISYNWQRKRLQTILLPLLWIYCISKFIMVSHLLHYLNTTISIKCSFKGIKQSKSLSISCMIDLIIQYHSYVWHWAV